MADVAHEQEAAAGQHQLAPAHRLVAAVFVQAADLALAAFVERRLQIAAQHAQPVRISRDLVLGVDHGDRVLEVDDRRQC
ncbi:hypothetical protein VF14_28130 [Nostoc linckia z18]|nr:hypothetical protein VF14_28130 [Nostoc linckia z18]